MTICFKVLVLASNDVNTISKCIKGTAGWVWWRAWVVLLVSRGQGRYIVHPRITSELVGSLRGDSDWFLSDELPDGIYPRPADCGPKCDFHPNCGPPKSRRDPNCGPKKIRVNQITYIRNFESLWNSLTSWTVTLNIHIHTYVYETHARS